MLIKATRIRTATGATALARHLTQGDENEAIVVVRGTVADLHDAVADARRYSRSYALRHFVIAPQISMGRQQFERAAAALGEEFGFDVHSALVVEHQKARATPGVADRHWHIVVAEVDTATGKVLSSRFSHPRHEKVARMLELEFSHPVIPGAHDKAVVAALNREGRGDLAELLSTALGHGPKPVAAYSVEAHQTGKRKGVDLAQARQHIRSAWAASTNGDGFKSRLAEHGLELAEGDKAGVVIIRDLATGGVLGAASRLAGVRRAQLNTLLERTDNDPQLADRRPDAPGRHSDSQTGPGDDSRIGKGDRPAAGGRASLGSQHDGEPAANDSRGSGAESQIDRGSPPTFGRAWDRPYASANDRDRLTIAIAQAAAALLALSKTEIGQSQAERTRQHLAGLETQARANIAATESNQETAVSNRLHAARLYRDGTHARHADMLKQYRAAQEQLAAHVEPRPTFADRMLGRQPENSRKETLEQTVAAARADLVAAEKAAAGADGHLSRVERDEAAQRTQHMAQMETQRRAAMEILAQVVMAQRMVKAFPALAYTGPAFTAWSGGKVERKRRRGLRNPWARNIWGIPLDFG